MEGMTDASAAILVVEDDPAVRTFLADNLTADGYELHVAETIRDAVRVLEYKQPDVAIVDLGLPDGSGLDLLGRVRGADGVTSRLDPGLPVLLLTGRAGELDRIRGFERGADDFVAKPMASVPTPSGAASERNCVCRSGPQSATLHPVTPAQPGQ
jgi:DNA-binding response OmpR family regulator